MSRIARLLLMIGFASCCVVPLTAFAEDELTASEKDAIEWFDSLAFPDLKDLKCVRVTLTYWSLGGTKLQQSDSFVAFLLSDQEDSFTVFTLELFTRTYSKSPPAELLDTKGEFEPAELAGEATAQLKWLLNPEPDEDRWRRFGAMVSERVEVFVLGRACAAQGFDDLAHRLLVAAAAMPPEQRRDRDGPISLKDALADEIGHSMMWRGVLDFGDPSISRKELLAKFRTFLEQFPRSEHAERARETADLLAQMVEEDEQHEKAERKPWAEMTNQERVAELIFQLRDQNGQQWSQPGACDIFLDPRGDESPAAQLVKIGYDAVPQLIEAIDDRGFTRSVGYYRNYFFSHGVLRVGDCAVDIIGMIAGRHFYDDEKDGDEAVTTKRQIEAWWREIQEKGEKQVLVEGVARGDYDSGYLARHLIEKYPDEALEALRQGIAASEPGWTRDWLLRSVAELKGEAVVDFLLRQMDDAADLSTRVSAAQGLLMHGRPEAVPAMIREWRQLDPREESGQLVDFLALCGKPEAIDVLREGLGRRDVDMRYDVVTALRDSGGNLDLFSYESADGFVLPDKAEDPSPQVLAAIEALLIQALTDTEARMGMWGSLGDVEFHDPRICDTAAYSLSIRFPQKYHFDYSASLLERDRQLIVLQNIWREEHHVEALPMPPERKNPGLPSDVTRPLLERIAAAGAPDDRRGAIIEIDKLGLPALPAVAAFYETLLADHPARFELAALASQLANVVAEIQVEPESLAMAATVNRRVAELEGKPLRAESFIDLLRETAGELPDGTTGVTVTAYRFNDHTGVRLTLAFRGDVDPLALPTKEWKSYERVRIGADDIHGSAGSPGYEYALRPESYEDLSRDIRKALDVPPSVDFFISASLQLRFDR